MKPQGIHLVWIVVLDIQKAIEFYTKTIGLTLIPNVTQKLDLG